MIRTLTHLHRDRGFTQGDGGDGRRRQSSADLTGNAGGSTEAAEMSRGCTLGSGQPEARRVLSWGVVVAMWRSSELLVDAWKVHDLAVLGRTREGVRLEVELR